MTAKERTRKGDSNRFTKEQLLEGDLKINGGKIRSHGGQETEQNNGKGGERENGIEPTTRPFVSFLMAMVF